MSKFNLLNLSIIYETAIFKKIIIMVIFIGVLNKYLIFYKSSLLNIISFYSV